MKIPKKIYLPIAAVLLVVGVGVTLVLNNPDGTPKKEVALKQTSTTVKSEPIEPIQSTPITEAVPKPAPAAPPKTESKPVEQVTAPTPEENKVRAMKAVNDYAASQNWLQYKVTTQAVCFDRMIQAGPGYTNYDAIAGVGDWPLLKWYLEGKMYFDGAGTCRIKGEVRPNV